MIYFPKFSGLSLYNSIQLIPEIEGLGYSSTSWAGVIGQFPVHSSPAFLLTHLQEYSCIALSVSCLISRQTYWVWGKNTPPSINKRNFWRRGRLQIKASASFEICATKLEIIIAKKYMSLFPILIPKHFLKIKEQLPLQFVNSYNLLLETELHWLDWLIFRVLQVIKTLTASTK